MLRKIVNFLFDSVYQVVTWVWIAASISSFFFFAGKPIGQRAQGMAWSAISLCVAVVSMIVLLARRYFVEERPEKKRAELRVTKAAVRLRVGKPEEVAIEIRNFGQLTAHDLQLEGRTYVLPKEFNEPLPREDWTSSASPQDIAPDAVITTVLIGDKGWTQSGINMADNKEILLFHYSEGTYVDASKTKYPISFCLKYEPGFPIMSVCDRCYWPKKK